MKDMIALESELVNRDIQITSLQDELSSSKVSRGGKTYEKKENC